MIFGAGAVQSTDPKSQLRPRPVNGFQLRPSVVQPADPSREKLAILLGALWSTLLAQPVSSRPEMVPWSTRRQVFPWSELRQRPQPTALIVTSPVSRFTITPEKPPGHASLAPLLVKRSSSELEISVHAPAAWIEADKSPARTLMSNMIPRR
jgi:hypothetical protein